MGAVVPENTKIEPRVIVAGIPAKKIRELSEEEAKKHNRSANLRRTGLKIQKGNMQFLTTSPAFSYLQFISLKFIATNYMRII